MPNNPLDFLTKQQIDELELTPEELSKSYQPSGGGVFHARGTEDAGKTLWIARFYKYLIDSGIYLPTEAVGNITFRGKYGVGYQVKKGEELHDYLWELTHKPYQHKIVIIDEIDSEFPARFFPSREQTETALRMWHIRKLHNVILMSSHLGRSTDLIFDLATHYKILPTKPNWETNSMEFTVINRLDKEISDWCVGGVIEAMLIYNRRELTESGDSERKRPTKKEPKEKLPARNEEEQVAIFDEISSDLPSYQIGGGG